MRWRNVFSPRKVVNALRIEGATLAIVARHGLPDRMPQFLGGLGDELLLTCVARELKKRAAGARIWQVSAAAELLEGNPDYHRVFSMGDWELRYSNLLNGRRLKVRYSEMPEEGERETPVSRHILAELCARAGIAGEIELRPWFVQSGQERARGRVAARQAAVHSGGAASHPNVMINKLWFHERFQDVVDRLRETDPGLTLVQLGVPADPPLRGVLDLRGRTRLRESAAVLSESEWFLGTSGLLSHLARAVECRSVVVYGGREHAWQTGYPCNENLETCLPCAPCWRWNRCERARECMRLIGVERVLGAVEKLQARKGVPLEVQMATV
jgi:hypothetical protein